MLKNEFPIRLFVGYDERLTLNWHVFAQSVIEKSTVPISIMPLKLNHLSAILKREKTPDQLTDFSYSRFLVPYLCQYQGWAIFMDATDMMLRDDLAKLWALREEQYEVMVVKHAEITGNHHFMGKTIASYKMFNWSSLMLFNNKKCSQLTPHYVNTVAYHELHQFSWTLPQKIGELPARWNHLVGYSSIEENISLVHWTQGVPQNGHPKDLAFEDEWLVLMNKVFIC